MISIQAGEFIEYSVGGDYRYFVFLRNMCRLWVWGGFTRFLLLLYRFGFSGIGRFRFFFRCVGRKGIWSRDFWRTEGSRWGGRFRFFLSLFSVLLFYFLVFFVFRVLVWRFQFRFVFYRNVVDFFSFFSLFGRQVRVVTEMYQQVGRRMGNKGQIG